MTDRSETGIAAEAIKAHAQVPLTLLFRTVSTLNTREHWSKRAKRAKFQRLVARSEVLSWFDVGMLAMGSVHVFLTRIAPRSLDGDNLQGALKNVRDGVADALGVNDNDPRVSWIYGQRRGKPREYAVTVEITP